MLLIVFPLLKRTGYGFDERLYILLNWSALRGSVGLCCALIICGQMEFGFAYKKLVLF